MKNKEGFILLVIMLGISLFFSGCAQKKTPMPKPTFDIVITGGTVMDPGTRTDVLANVGISKGRICAVVSPDEKLEGKEAIDAAGLVVAPGFIDMHAHEGIISMTMKAHVLDGVTTMIGGNCGGHPYPH